MSNVTRVVIDGVIRIHKPPKSMREAVMAAHRVKNPDYHRLIQKNKRLRFSPHLSEYVRYYDYDKKNDVLSVGRGSLERLRAYAERARTELAIDDRRVHRRVVFPEGIVRLRDYQVGVPEAMRGHDQGLARCDTGFGKTVVALELARQLGERTLVVVPKLDLLEQFAEAAETLLRVRPGIVQGTEHRIGDEITIATSQTLRNRIIEGRMKRDEFGCLVVDECHLFVPEKRRRTIEWFSAHHRYGFTGTDRRTDGQGEALNFIFGGKIIDKIMPRKAPRVRFVRSTGRYFGIEYHEIIDEQVRDDARNKMIASLAKEAAAKGRKVLVLTKRVEHYETIASLCASPKTRTLSSSSPKQERKTLLDAMRKDPSTYDILLGTFALLGTGTDIPSLDTLIIAGDLKSDVLTEQSAGRILRLFEGKDDPEIIDVVDLGNGILKNQARKRKAFYESVGWHETL